VKQSQLIEKALGNMFGNPDNEAKKLDDSTKKTMLDKLKTEN
jgi:hypothetical protein